MVRAMSLLASIISVSRINSIPIYSYMVIARYFLPLNPFFHISL